MNLVVWVPGTWKDLGLGPPGTWDESGHNAHVNHNDLLRAGWKYIKDCTQSYMYCCPGVESISPYMRGVAAFRDASDVSKILQRIRVELPNQQYWRELSEE